MTTVTPPLPTRSRLNSVFLKATAIVAVCIALVAGVLTYVSYTGTYAAAHDTLVAKGKALTELAAKTAGGPLKFNKPDLAMQAAQQLVQMDGNEIIEVIFLKRDGTVLADYVSEEFPTESRAMIEHGRPMLDLVNALAPGTVLAADQEMSASGNGLILAQPVYFGIDNDPAGVMITRQHDARVTSMMDTILIKALTAAGIIFALSVIGASFLFRQTISQPLTRLSEAVRKVAAGDYTSDIRGTTARDEVGEIARAVQDLRNDLHASEAVTRIGMFKGSGFEGASAALIITDLDFDILFLNPAARSLLADAFPAANMAGDIKGTSVLTIDPGLAALKTLSRNPLPQRLGFAAGQEMFDVALNAVRDGAGTLTGYVLEWRSTTQSRRNAAVLSAIDAGQLRAEISPTGKVDVANATFAALLGLDASAMRGRDLTSALHMAAPDAPPLWSALRAGTAEAALLRLALPSGGDALLDARFSPITDDTGAVRSYLLLASDITRQHHAMTEADAQRRAMELALSRVVEGLRAALTRLSEGDLTSTISEPFASDYEQLRHDFNEAADRLRAAMAEVVENADAIRGEVGDISAAATDLSRRTEQQAATLEQTAAALDQMTTSVQSTAQVATNANTKVEHAKKDAESSGQVVREAVAAMGEIAQSSSKISRITSVIDEIAFQTNLLALNAGVEAARAGEAGRGFAVVASEVRDLAQRSSEAAREIAGLINASSDHVKRGVNLVADAGRSLTGIQTSVGEIHDLVSTIASAAKEQSNGIAELNTAVKHLDQVTQQNAAMFEETSAASQSLNLAAETLAQTTSRFTIGRTDGPRKPAPAATSATAQSWGTPARNGAGHAAPASAFQSRRTPSGEHLENRSAPPRRAVAGASSAAQEGWEDF